MSRSGAMVNKIIKRDGKDCHYCGRTTVRSDAERLNRFPTVEHVLPRSLGGENSIENYVLACYKCNQKRGSHLFYCDCRECQEKILDALYSPARLQRIFDAIVAHNKPLISKDRKPVVAGRGKWKVRIGHNQQYFYTFEEAVKFASTATFVKDRDYA